MHELESILFGTGECALVRANFASPELAESHHGDESRAGRRLLETVSERLRVGVEARRFVTHEDPSLDPIVHAPRRGRMPIVSTVRVTQGKPHDVMWMAVDQFLMLGLRDDVVWGCQHLRQVVGVGVSESERAKWTYFRQEGGSFGNVAGGAGARPGPEGELAP